jgi:hypothetical protein
LLLLEMAAMGLRLENETTTAIQVFEIAFNVS